MFNFLQAWKEARTAKAEEVRHNLKRRRDEAKLALKRKTLAMLRRKCPFNGMRHCTVECVHFAAGEVHEFGYIDGETGRVNRAASIFPEGPTCRLWRG